MQDAAVAGGVGLVAVDLVGVEPLLLAGVRLPHREQPVDVAVEEEHERILERLVLAADVAADVAVCRAVIALKCLRNACHCWAGAARYPLR